MNEYKDKHGDTWGQGAAGGAYQNKSQMNRDLNRQMKGIAWYFVTLFGKPRTTGQRVMKVLTWIFTIVMLGIILMIFFGTKVAN
jgi:hypothetical protein